MPQDFDLLSAISGSVGRGLEDDEEAFEESGLEPPALKRCRVDGGPPSRQVAARKGHAKVGVGFVGLPLVSMGTALAEKTLKKRCAFCKQAVFSKDPIDDMSTLAWHKPRYEGRMCAYCGNTKMRLFPHREASSALCDVEKKKDDNDRFFKYRAFLVGQHSEGHRTLRKMADSTPLEQVKRTSEFNVVKSDVGTMQLYDSYVKKHGDPSLNGYSTTETTWKGGSWRKVVLIPKMAEGEMERRWEQKSGYAHTTMLDDGQVTMEPGQQASLVCDLAIRAAPESHDWHDPSIARSLAR